MTFPIILSLNNLNSQIFSLLSLEVFIYKRLVFTMYRQDLASSQIEKGLKQQMFSRPFFNLIRYPILRIFFPFF